MQDNSSAPQIINGHPLILKHLLWQVSWPCRWFPIILLWFVICLEYGEVDTSALHDDMGKRNVWCKYSQQHVFTIPIRNLEERSCPGLVHSFSRRSLKFIQECPKLANSEYIVLLFIRAVVATDNCLSTVGPSRLILRPRSWPVDLRTINSVDTAK